MHVEMTKALQQLIIFFNFALSFAKDDPELPLCPTNIQFLPQSLPMHCRMPAGQPQMDFMNMLQKMPGGSTFPPPFYQRPPPDEAPQPMPFPAPPGFPGPMFPQPGMPGPMPLMPAAPAHKLPVIVMPFYSPDPGNKKRIMYYKKHDDTSRDNSDVDTGSDSDRDRSRKKKMFSGDSSDTDTTDTSQETSIEAGGWWKPRHKISRNSGIGRRSNKHSHSSHNRHKKHNKRNELLTPIIQYVTKDGYVIFEKEITNNEAKNWLDAKNKDDNNISSYFEGDKAPADNGNNKDDGEVNDDNDNDDDEKPFITLEEEQPTTTQINLEKAKENKDKGTRRKSQSSKMMKKKALQRRVETGAKATKL